MDLTIYEIIQGPVITEKAYELNKRLKKLVVKVHPKANKTLVKKALETLFDVKVSDINISVRKGKFKNVGRRKGIQGSSVKKAYVTLKEGYTLDLLDQSTVGVAGQDSNTKNSKVVAAE
jgi:large subunit ribosomal protein L23